ncbi:MAG: glycerophosphodiester phosphodiesterase [Candidatus Micrarchaeota archaeon]|nr:glycerophosphodiester phosphodiesterase [Candidatus Micrarchaeota archaeon]MDE1859113.1 glycerophosphodiester phosphodiesterase [Candidatus Micrarchaeota archaeon]
MLRIGHRGTLHEAPENTKAAFRKALRSGADGVELDVRRSRDDILVVHHDPKIDLDNGRQLLVKDLSAAELKSYGIDTLDEVIDAILVVGKPKLIDIEIKVNWVETQVLSKTHDKNIEDVAIITSFRKEVLKNVRSIDSKIKTGLIKEVPSYSTLRDAEAVGASYIIFSWEAAKKQFIDMAHGRGFAVMVWAVNNEKDIRRMQGLGVDGIFTDFTKLLRP